MAKYHTKQTEFLAVTMEISINIIFVLKNYISISIRSVVSYGWSKPVQTSPKCMTCKGIVLLVMHFSFDFIKDGCVIQIRVD